MTMNHDPGQSGVRLSRRNLLKGAASLSALAAMPWSMRQAYAQQASSLLIIGGGTAGMIAAICAARRGASVVVIEKAAEVGGSLTITGGNLGAAGTVFQKSIGVDDTAQLHYDDIIRISNGTAIPEMARLWADNAGAMINWLADLGLDIPEDRLSYGVYDHYQVRRYHGAPQGGRSILAAMRPEFERFVAKGRIRLMTEAGAVDLIQDARGAINGVVVEDASGKRSDVHGRSTIISTGGCAGNHRMFESLHGVPLYRSLAKPTSQGAGLMLGLAAGGYLRCAENYIGYHGAIAPNDQWPYQADASMAVDPRVREPWEIHVNARGERFVREDHPSMSERNRRMDQQPGHAFWVVFDQRAFDSAPSLIPGWDRERILREFNSHSMFHRAPTLKELGVRAGIAPAALKETVDAYNAAISAGRPDPLGREAGRKSIEQGPYYAIRSQTYTLKSYVGLGVDKHLQVTTAGGEPIRGLYAAGEVLGAATGGKAHTNGASLTPALTFGKLLGEKIVPI